MPWSTYLTFRVCRVAAEQLVQLGEMQDAEPVTRRRLALAVGACNCSANFSILHVGHWQVSCQDLSISTHGMYEEIRNLSIEPQFGKVPSFVCVHSFAQRSTFFTMFEQRFTPGECDVQHVVQGATFGTTCNVTTCMQRLVLYTMCHVLHNYPPKIGKGLSPRRRFWPQINLFHKSSRRFCHMQRKLNLHHSVK